MEKKNKKVVREKDKRNLFKKVEKMKAVQELKEGISEVRSTKLVNFRKVVILVIAIILLSLVMLFTNNEIREVTKLEAELASSMTYDQVQAGDAVTNSEYVNFDAFFLKDIDGDGYADGVRGTSNEVKGSDTLYIELNVLTRGYFKDGKITINSENFYFNASIPKDEEIKENYVGLDIKEIELNTIKNGTEKTISGVVQSGDYTLEAWRQAGAIGNKDEYSKINSIVLTGTHVEELEDGTTKETAIEKEVNIQVDWHGKVICEDWISLDSQWNNAEPMYNEENGEFNLKIQMGAHESAGQLITKEMNVKATIPQINGYSPIRVESSSNNVTVEYNQSTRVVTVKQSIEEIAVYESVYITIVYPGEVYDYVINSEEIMEISADIYFVGYNNPNDEFDNPYISNTITDTYTIVAKGMQAFANLYVGEIISPYGHTVSKQKPLRIYNGISQKEAEDQYKLRLSMYTKQSTTKNGMIIKEKRSEDMPIADRFIKSDNTEESMEKLLTNIGVDINLSLESDEGWVKIYNDVTDELIVTLMKTELDNNKYYKFSEPVKHIRIETSTVSTNSNIDITYIKEIDDEYLTTNYTREEFDDLSKIKSTLQIYMDNYTIEATGEAKYIVPISKTNITLNKSAITTQKKEESLQITITTDTQANKNKSKWKDGEFLVKLPEEIIELKLNNISINNEKVKLTNYKIIEQNNQKFIKVETKNDEEADFAITIDCEAIPDSRISTITSTIELFECNPYNPLYESSVEDLYDVNDNGNITELIGKETTTLTLAAPSSLLTSAIITNYDANGSTAIAPNKAYISKYQRTAKMIMEIKNNYENTISEITILGKIPTEGTNYVINGAELNSEYSTTMTDEGIVLPTELQETSTIYYSEQANPTKDLTDAQNGWTTTPTDFSKIKSFLIELGEYILSKSEEKQISYEVNIPQGLDYNKISHGHHAVYFCLDTTEGKYATQTETSESSLMIARLYNLEITKYQRNTELPVSGATYLIREEGTDEITAITQDDGKITKDKLFVEKEYTIQEIISPEGYELNTEEIKFEVVEDEKEELELNIIKGTVKNADISKINTEDYIAQIAVEDELTANMAEKVTVHHYIYDEKTNTYTTINVPLQDGTEAQDVVIQGSVGEVYEITPLSNIDVSYEIYETPENTSITLSKTATEVSFYYKLKESTLTSAITKTATATTNKNGIAVLTEEDGIVTYQITYTATVGDYIGQAKFTILDKLPANINESQSDLDGGIYNSTDKTITWEETAEIDTYTNGEYTYTTTKTIKVVYTNQDVTTALVNEASAKVIINYPDNYPITPGEERANEISEATSTVEQKYNLNLTITKVWDHTNNEDGEHPTSIVLQVKNGDTVVSEKIVGEADGWKYNVYDLPRYDSEGNIITYTVGEREVIEGDLAQYKAEINGTTITNKYNGAVIVSSKQGSTEYNNNYVVKGEKITYTVKVRNEGGLAENVVVKDIIPFGTSFVENSIAINGEIQRDKTAEDLTNGITVNIPAKIGYEDGITTLTFEVTVNENATGIIKNSATVLVKGEETITNEVEYPVVKISKTSEVTRKSNDVLEANEVTVTDEIKYTIKVENTSSVDFTGIDIIDSIPVGTSLKQINNNGTQKENNISWIIDVEANRSEEVSFIVIVDYAKEVGSIKNVATVDGIKTNEIENLYNKPEAEIATELTKTGETEILSAESNVYYEVNYTATIKDFEGTAYITIVDTLPYEIDETSSQLQGGTYDNEAKTITWTEEIRNIKTFTTNEDKQIAITKAISLKYKYGNINTMDKVLENKVTVTTELKENDIVVKKEIDETTQTAQVKIPAKVTTHHYIYVSETNAYTTTSIVEDVVENGIVGQTYTTTKSNQVPINYTCITETPEKQSGTMTYEDIEVTYYYQLEDTTITSETTKTATANKTKEREQEDGSRQQVAVLTQEDGVVTYKIVYTATLEDYIGQAKFTVVDKLPAEIDEAKSDLAGGTYNATAKTITWEEITKIDTYENGTYKYNLVKTIKLVYTNQDVTKALVNEATGKVTTYYPDSYPLTPGEEKDTKEATATSIVEQEYLVNRKVSKVWNDNRDAKGRRPENVTIKLTADGQIVENHIVKLSETNNWKHEFINLPKYNNLGQEINYSVVESETEVGDLEYYEEPEIAGTNEIIVTNTYKLKNTTLDSELTKETQDTIGVSAQKVTYKLNYIATITDYIGEVLITLVDNLPLPIDEAKSSLQGGVYNEELQTITWTERIPHINTDTAGKPYELNLTKEIKVVYKNLDIASSSITNTATATLDLYETEQRNTVTAEEITNVDIQGKVIERYIDKETGKEIQTAKEHTGKAGSAYRVEKEEIPNYIYEESTNNIAGQYREGTIEVIHYYKKIPAKVIVKYVDEAGKELSPSEIVNGYVTKPYETTAKEIENYEKVRVNGNEKGEMTKADIEITYVYKKSEAKVIVQYLDKESNREIALMETIEGYAGDSYETSRKAIEYYQKAEPEPANRAGTMIKGETIVKYYYEKIPSGTITVKFVDIDTKEEITYKAENGETKTYSYTIQGKVGDKYKAEEKVIPYYKRLETLKPINQEGLLSQEDVKVTFYYKKLEFNLEISKKITEVKVNGKAQEIKEDKLVKVEIHAKKIAQTVVEVKYLVTVRNTGELEGTAKVLEKIPPGYKVSANNPGEWQKNKDGNLECTISLKAGESKELEVILNWEQNGNNFGEKKNMVSLTNINNLADYAESSTEDNKGEASLLMNIRTGRETQILIVVLGFIATSGSLILGYEYELYRKQRKQTVRMVKLEGKNVVIHKEVQK